MPAEEAQLGFQKLGLLHAEVSSVTRKNVDMLLRMLKTFLKNRRLEQ